MRIRLNWVGAALLIVAVSLTPVLAGCGDDSVTNGTSNKAPNMPTDLSPADGSTIGVGHATLTWTCTDPDGDELTYDVHFATDPDPRRVRENLTVCSHQVYGLLPGDTYYWKVVARDPEGLETGTEVVSFTVSP